jgi:transposase
VCFELVVPLDGRFLDGAVHAPDLAIGPGMLDLGPLMLDPFSWQRISAADTECFQIFLDTLAKRFSRQHILLILDGAPNHTTDDLAIPANITLEFLPPAPELNPQENIWDEIREKIFKNYALKSMDEVCDKLEEAALYIERNPKMVNLLRRFRMSSVQCDV